MRNLLKSWLCRPGLNWLRQPKARQVRTSLATIEGLESRQLLTAWDRDWAFIVVSGTDLPGTNPPYELSINTGSLNAPRKGQGLSLVEVPGEGNAPFKKVKIKGDTLKGTVKSGDLKGKVELQGDFEDNRTPNDGDTFTGGMTFTIKIPGGQTINININVSGSPAAG